MLFTHQCGHEPGLLYKSGAISSDTPAVPQQVAVDRIFLSGVLQLQALAFFPPLPASAGLPSLTFL